MMPVTNSGRWAGRLLATAGICFAIFLGVVAAGEKGGDTFFSNLRLSLPILAAAAAAIAAGGTGLAAVRQHDRSALVIAAVVVGTIVVLWTAAEIALPH